MHTCHTQYIREYINDIVKRRNKRTEMNNIVMLVTDIINIQFVIKSFVCTEIMAIN